ncbi:MAG: response regulator transcription factor [Clostridia bacterium]|nr:response regulator transcription factor [Clostridia bacterium]
MKLRIAICDDARSELEYVEKQVSAWGESRGHFCEIQTFPSAEAFLFAGAVETWNILLLDVEMPGMSGIELAKHLRREGIRAEILFITSHFEFAGEGYEVDALHYLVKPVAEDKLFEVLDKAADRLAEEPPSVVVPCEGETVRLYETEILYAEAFLHYINIHTDRGEYRIKESLSAFAERLGADFYRIHRSYLVSLKHITRISRTSVHIGSVELPLSRGKYDDINRAFIERN